MLLFFKTQIKNGQPEKLPEYTLCNKVYSKVF